IDTARPPLGIGLEDDLRVAAREKAIALVHQLAAQLAVIVDAAVESDRETELRIDHRLLGGGSKIDNAEPAMPERGAILCKRAAGIRPARPHRFSHCAERTAGRTAVKSHLAANAAHF